MYMALVFSVGVLEFSDPRTLNGTFVMDDLATIARHPYVISNASGVAELFGLDFWGTPLQSATSHKSWRPVTTLSFRLQAGELQEVSERLFKNGVKLRHGESSNFSLFWFHLVNVLLHGINSVLCLFVARYFFPTSSATSPSTSPSSSSSSSATSADQHNSTALLAALLFAAHPMHCEAVSNVSGRAELLCLTFFMLGFLLYAQTPTGSFVRDFLSLSGVLVCTVLAMLSKEQGILLPPICVGWDLLARSLYKEDGNLRKGFIGRSVVLGLSTLFLGAFRLALNGQSAASLTCLQNHIACLPTVGSRFLSFVYLAWVNLYFLLLPLWTSCDWSGESFPAVEWYHWKAAVAILFVIVIVTCLHYMIDFALTKPNANQPRTHILCAFWLLGTFIFSSNLVTHVGFVVAERTMYLPSFGACVLIAFVLKLLTGIVPPASRNVAFWGLGLLLLSWYTPTTQQWNLLWRHELPLYENAYAQAPLAVSTAARYGSLLVMDGQLDEGIKVLEFALSPPLEMGWNTVYCEHITTALRQRGRCAEAMQWTEVCRARVATFAQENLAQIAGKIKNGPLTFISVRQDAKEGIRREFKIGERVKITTLEVCQWKCLSLLRNATLKITQGDQTIQTVMNLDIRPEGRDFLVETLKLDPNRTITWWDEAGEERLMYDSEQGEMASVVSAFKGVFPHHLLTQEEILALGENRVLRMPEESAKPGWHPPAAPVWSKDRYAAALPR